MHAGHAARDAGASGCAKSERAAQRGAKVRKCQPAGLDTSLVLSKTHMKLLRPKSAILTSPRPSRRRFSGLRSL